MILFYNGLANIFFFLAGTCIKCYGKATVSDKLFSLIKGTL